MRTEIWYRFIPNDKGACRVCDKLTGHVLRVVDGKERLVARVHGPRNNRCGGSYQPHKPWLAATHLPTWDQMTELDKGAALLHVWKRQREGAEYAISDYPCRYFSYPVMVALAHREASRHAQAVTGGWNAINERTGEAEVARLYYLALAADDERTAKRAVAAR